MPSKENKEQKVNENKEEGQNNIKVNIEDIQEQMNNKDYMALIAPLPIALALLFVFLSQINRAQRQLVAISKYIHDIKYTEEIMLAINSLSVDIDDSMKRINTAMDRLLDRHLSCNLNFLDETSLHEQENKDENVVPVNQVADILKRVIENNN